MALLHMETAPASPPNGGGRLETVGALKASAPSAKKPNGADAKSNMMTHRALAAKTLNAKIAVVDSEDESKALLRSSSTLDLGLTLLERYQNAVSTKMFDVEELVDYYFHRRLAAVTAVVISYLPFVVTPNQITIFGLGLGWASALCLYDSEFHYPLAWHPHESLLAASLFMFLWIVSDCADGQVARLCKRGTRTGRILDGVVDGLVIAPNMWILGLLSANRYGTPYFYVAIISGFSLWLHAIIYDKIKNTYMENALPFSECDGETVESVKLEFAEAKAKDPYSLESILLGIYVVYLMVQTAVTSDAASKAESTRHGMLAKCDDHYHASYINKYGYVVRLASFLGISAHVTGLYVAYFAAIYVWDALFYVQMYFLVALNGLLLVVLSFYFKSGMATQQPLNSAM